MAPGAAFPAASESHGAQAEPTWRWAAGLDIVVGAILAIGAVVALAALPTGSGLRLAVALPMLGLVPGYLLIEAVAEPAKTARTRLLRLVYSLGVSPPFVGLLALSTSLVPGGFRPIPILVLVVLTCLTLGSVALWRRAQTRPRSAVP